MEYRDLGKTGIKVSAVGMGSCGVPRATTEHAVGMVHRALDLGVTYFDTARSYGDGEIRLGLGLKGRRSQVFLSTKTNEKTREAAWRQINESLERLGTDYVDNIHLHGLQSGDDLEQRLGAGGALEALVQAEEQGLTRHIGCTSHRSVTLIEALGRFDFEIILVPMNIIEREPLDELIPLCRRKGVGVTIMKPVATGEVPAGLSLKWLLNQPVDCLVPGAANAEQVQENALVGHNSLVLTHDEQARIARIKEAQEHTRCRICGLCLPCPVGIPVDITLGTDVFYDFYRNMGRDAFRRFPFEPLVVERELLQRQSLIAKIEACTRCGDCDKRCPYGLPAMDMLQRMVPAMRDMAGLYGEMLSA